MLLCAALMLAIAVSCGEKKADDVEDMAAGAAEELADSTRMDSAMIDSMAGEMADSAGALMEEGKEMMEEGKEMIEGGGN